MDQIARYRPRSLLIRLALNHGLELAELVQRSGLPRQLATDASASVTAAQYFRIWEAVDNLTPGGMTLDQIRTSARGAFSAQAFAFSSSASIETGLARLALLKPLSGPYQLRVRRSDRLEISFHSADPAIDIPPQLHRIEIIQLLELLRMCGQRVIVPMAISMPEPVAHGAAVTAYAGVAVTQGPLALSLSLEDAAHPLMPVSAEHWAAFEPTLMQQIARATAARTITQQLRAALFQTLPSGRASVDDMATHMATSKRSLQRRLKAEKSSFGEVLEATRHELALHYLTIEDLRVEEVSHLLAFRDPNSFYRAFQSWTGMTPRQARLAHQRATGGSDGPQN